MAEFDIGVLTELLLEKKTTYLIGAGASAPYFKSLGQFETILTNEDLNHYDQKLVKIIFYIASIKDNIELIINSENNRRDTIKNEYKHFLYNIIEYQKFMNSHLTPRRTSILTTNYDLFLEAAAEEINHDNSFVYFNDGSSGFFTKKFDTENFNKAMEHRGINDNYSKELPTINLIKSHGSVNWEKTVNGNINIKNDNFLFIEINHEIESMMGEINLPENWNIVSGETSREKLLSFIDNIINLWPNDINYKTNFEQIIMQVKSFTELNQILIHNIFEKIEKLQIVWPTKKKFEQTLINQHYYEMLRLFSYELESQERILIVFGFSFYDEHIKNIVKRSLKNPGLIVYIFCFKNKDRENIMGVFDFTENSIPNNIIFVYPDLFLKHNINLEDIETDDENIDYLIINNGDDNLIYDNILSKNKNWDNSYEVVLSFKSFNTLISANIPNKFDYSLRQINGDTDEN